MREGPFPHKVMPSLGHRLIGHGNVSMTGDMLGTLRYMSPEQALAKRGYLDHRTDIYSLGVTLYELLTLRPAIDGQDRQEVLRKIAQEEPPPPRRLISAIPRELETVLLKAMNKEPQGRFPTSQELADDLRRFLDHRPIQAKRPTPLERAAKLARRHRMVVTTAVLFLLLAVTTLAVSTVLIARQERKAERQRDRAVTAEGDALAQRDRAEINFRRARDAVDQMLTEVSEKALADIPQAEPIGRALLEKAAAFYRDFLAEQAPDRSLLYDSAEAYSRLARVEAELGHPSEAAQAFERQIGLLQGLLKRKPERAEYLRDLVWAHFRLAWQRRARADLDAALVEMGRAVDTAQTLVDRYPMNPADRKPLARSLDLHAVLLWQTGQLREAEAEFNRSIEISERLIHESPAQAPQSELAAALNNLAGLRGDCRIPKAVGATSSASADENILRSAHTVSTRVPGRSRDPSWRAWPGRSPA